MPNRNRALFQAAENKLTALGWRPTNPTKMRNSKAVGAESQALLNAGKDYARGKLYQRHMRTCFRHVLQSRALFCLPGWQKSQNASFEVELALRAGIDVYEYESGLRIVR